MLVDVVVLGVDFYCIIGYKLYGFFGLGVIWILCEC